VIGANQWVNCPNTPLDLVEAASIEIGPAVLLPDGRVFAVGATNHTALYTIPPNANQPGTWANGPTFPLPGGVSVLGAKDAPGCLLPNGLVLCVAGPVDGVSLHYLSPTYFFEFNPNTNTLAAITNPPTNGGPPYVGRFLLLPTGQVLFANGSANVQVYTPAGAPDPMWKPNITSVPLSLVRGGTYTLYGRQINGLSQAVAYGDDATMATNYPLVRLRDVASGHVFYCRTSNHSTLGVNTGTTIHYTRFLVPAGAELGAADITVVVNGIASDPVRVTVSSTTILAERADQAAEDGNVLQPFIQEEERPEVGGAAIGSVYPASNPVKTDPRAQPQGGGGKPGPISSTVESAEEPLVGRIRDRRGCQHPRCPEVTPARAAC
jgi:hypothetical protein